MFRVGEEVYSGCQNVVAGQKTLMPSLARLAFISFEPNVIAYYPNEVDHSIFSDIHHSIISLSLSLPLSFSLLVSFLSAVLPLTIGLFLPPWGIFSEAGQL